MRKNWLLIVQTFLSVLLLWRLFGNAELRTEAALVLEKADAAWLVAGLATAILTELLCAFRWWFMLRIFGVPVGMGQTMAFSGAGLFFSLGLPGSGGGDAFRILYVMRLYPTRKLRAALSVVADRLCGLFALVLTVALPLSQASEFAANPQTLAVLAAAGTVLSVAVLLVLVWWLTTLPSLHKKWIHLAPKKIRTEAVRMGHIFWWLGRNPKQLAAALLLSVVALLLHFSTYWFGTMAFSLGLSLRDMLVVMPLVDTLTMLPVTLFGIGLRETLFEYLLGGLWNIAPGSATLASLGGFTLQAAVALLGGLLIPFTVPQAAPAR
ncbi:MAG: lysylphosphatidylglycerol synthase transmembrane domain-containing protein [Sphaerospermopsis kisseleviana]